MTLKGRGQHSKYMPYAFTEQGVAMLSSIKKQIGLLTIKDEKQDLQIKDITNVINYLINENNKKKAVTKK